MSYMTKRTIEELGDLLEQPYVAVMSTRRPDGSVLLSPVWHEWRDGGFNIGVGENDIKLRHIAQDPHVSVVVYDHSWPGRGFEVRGIARTTKEGRDEISQRLILRYLGPVNGAEYAKGVGSGIVVRVEPGDMRGWDYVDEIGPDPGYGVPVPGPLARDR